MSANYMIIVSFIMIFRNMRILPKSMATTKYGFTAVNNLSGPLRKHKFALTGSKGHVCEL